MQALAALRFVTFVEPLGSEVEADRFLDCEFESRALPLSSELEFGEGWSAMGVSIGSSACASGERATRISSVAILYSEFEQDFELLSLG